MAWEPKPEQICSEAGVFYTREDIEAYGDRSEPLWAYFKTWQRREDFRFNYNIYQKIMWHTVDGHPMRYREKLVDRFPHIPKSEPGKIAYTESDLKGNRDIQTVTTIGRYLTKFHSDLPEAEKKRLIDEWNSHYDTDHQLTFSDDPETIALIYMNGPGSCMSKDITDFAEDVPFGKHPAEVYGKPGDLSIAYLGTVACPVARAIVDIQRKYYVRAYGSIERMELKLKEAGFTKEPHWYSGTKLNLWQEGSRVLCPYLDGHRDYTWVIPSDDEFLLTTLIGHKGAVAADTTDGYIDFDRNTCECYHCSREVDLDNDDYSDIDDNVVCYRCRDEKYIYCHLTHEYVSNDTEMAFYYDRYGHEEIGQLSELENNPRYAQCEYSYGVRDEIRFYYRINTTTIELNDGSTIRVARSLEEEAYQHYLDAGLIDSEADVPEDDDEVRDTHMLVSPSVVAQWGPVTGMVRWDNVQSPTRIFTTNTIRNETDEAA